MINQLDDAELARVFKQDYPTHLQANWTTWRSGYLQHLSNVQAAATDTWLQPQFQQRLWDDQSVTGIGRGPIDVSGAFKDQSLARRLYDARESGLPQDIEGRAATLQELYDDIIARVYPRFADRRPRAKIARMLAALFPSDMTCLLNERAVWGTARLVGAERMPGEFIAQNPAIRARLREALGQPADLASEVDHSIFTWYLWQQYGPKPEAGAVLIQKPVRESADLPSLSMLPAKAQRRSLTCVSNNLDLLVAMVREAEQGISREDLLAAIQREAPYLNRGSASIIISQAQGGLGLIMLGEGGVYRPTERGLELLTAPRPADVLRAPLVNRVFGMGHLLLMLLRNPGLHYSEVAGRIRDLVPTWTSLRPGSELIQWAVLTELVRAEPGTTTSLYLTEAGEDYAAALPEDFEIKWLIGDSGGQGVLAAASVGGEVAVSEPEQASTPYGVEEILADGCFLSKEAVEAMVGLLRRKKNLILQGPPGTGKTWLAKRLGYALIGARDERRLTAVQFQPSMSYEDFVRGFRPGEEGRLELVDGLFLEAIESAEAEPDRPFVLVIEEINRGNPSQIFGELLTLLEHDKRRPEEALRLAYARSDSERVHVPANLHLIGTMNIADRSLALVDLALRRRFAFTMLKPAFGSAWRQWCNERAGLDPAVVSKIENRMQALNARIASHKALGEQFCVGHSYVTPNPAAPPSDAGEWFREVVETEIGPLLDEYWYDEPATAREATAALLAGP